MTCIPIYNDNGIVVNVVEINDDLLFLNGRVSKGNTLYYKGTGVNYNGHYGFLNNLSSNYKIIEKCPVFYAGYKIYNKNYQNKFGIFQERYQPYFTDFIGSCGAKEKLIVSNSLSFEKSSVDIFDCIEIDKENEQYYFELNYLCDRKSYLQYGQPKKLKELLEYMISSNWNFLWDKNTIHDLSFDGRVTDVADLFVSNELKHKLGTLYSVFYSLGKANPIKYLEFLKYNQMTHVNDMSYVYNALEFLAKNKIDISDLLISENEIEIYKNAVLNYIVLGKNCAHCSCDFNKLDGDKVMLQYATIISERFHENNF